MNPVFDIPVLSAHGQGYSNTQKLVDHDHDYVIKVDNNMLCSHQLMEIKPLINPPKTDTDLTRNGINICRNKCQESETFKNSQKSRSHRNKCEESETFTNSQKSQSHRNKCEESETFTNSQSLNSKPESKTDSKRNRICTSENICGHSYIKKEVTPTCSQSEKEALIALPKIETESKIHTGSLKSRNITPKQCAADSIFKTCDTESKINTQSQESIAKSSTLCTNDGLSKRCELNLTDFRQGRKDEEVLVGHKQDMRIIENNEHSVMKNGYEYTYSDELHVQCKEKQNLKIIGKDKLPLNINVMEYVSESYCDDKLNNTENRCIKLVGNEMFLTEREDDIYQNKYEADTTPSFSDDVIKQETHNQTYSFFNTVTMATDEIKTEVDVEFEISGNEHESTRIADHNKEVGIMANLESEEETHIELPIFETIEGEVISIQNGIIEKNVTPYKCGSCDYVTKYPHNLKNHLKLHSKEKLFICPVCSRDFRHAHHLDIHCRTHTGERPYVCGECGRTFTQSSNLRRHEQTHKGRDEDDLFTCDECDKKYTCYSNLKRHQLTHVYQRKKFNMCVTSRKKLKFSSLVDDDTRPYACDECGRRFSRKEHVKRHMHTHLGTKSHICEVCNKSFDRKDKFEEHLRIHTGD